MTADKNNTYESALTEFLELCEFTPDEIKAEWPRITKTFDIWEINTAEDFEKGMREEGSGCGGEAVFPGIAGEIGG